MKIRLAVPSIACAISAFLADACERGTEPPPPVTLNFAGRYTGWWTVEAADTVFSCGGIGGGGCVPIALEGLSCQVVTDISMQDDRHFSGSFWLRPPISNPSVSGANCDLANTKWLTLSLGGEIRGGILDSLSGETGSAAAQITFTVGDGSIAEMERLLGCTFEGERMGSWRMTGNARNERARFGSGTPVRFDVGAFGTRRFQCRGRRMDLSLTFSGEK